MGQVGEYTMILVVEKMEDQYKVKLLKGVDLALDIVESGGAECSVESSFQL